MRQKTFFIRPAPGIILKDPETGEKLPPLGSLMPRSAFWLRRLQDGDVVEDKTTQQTAQTAKAATNGSAKGKS